ncbi:MAG: hypothetical protein LBR15_08535 [Methanobrevibacter sp.]|jgi:vacuolar-type H+-ATPase subunit H|nr:hypothetical protein [Candidatus Methanovirga australis]
MVTVNNKSESHIKDYSSAKIQFKEDQHKDKFSKSPSSSKHIPNKRHNNASNNQSQGTHPYNTRNYNTSSVDDLKNEIKSLKTQLTEQKSDSRAEISDLKKKVFRLHNEKSQLLKNAEINEVKEIDHKLKNVEKLNQDLLKAQHKNKVIKDILDETREDFSSLKKDKQDLIAIIEDFSKLGFIDSIKGKKPDSYYKFFNR